MKPETFDTWMPRIFRTLAALIGLGLAIWEATSEHSAHPVVYLVSGAGAGIPLAGMLEHVVTKVTPTEWPLTPSSRSTPSEALPSGSPAGPIPSAGTQNGQPTPPPES